MLKHKTLLRTVPLLSAFLSGALYASSPAPSLNPTAIEIQPNKNLDAISNKRIYRTITVNRKDLSERFKVEYSKDAGSQDLRVTTVKNTCNDTASQKSACTITVEIVGPAGDFTGNLMVTGSTQTEPAKVSIRGHLSDVEFTGPKRKHLDSYELHNREVDYATVDLLSCKDLSYIDTGLQEQCKAFYNVMTGKVSAPAKTVCADAGDEIEQAKCEGLLRGTQFETCDSLDSVTKEFCTIVPKAATKACNEQDRDCQAIQRMMHGYMDCMSSGVQDFLPLCVAQQNAYMDGISGSWLKKLLFATGKPTIENEGFDNALSLAYIPQKRIDRLDINARDLKILMRAYPTIMRSALLNSPNSKAKNASPMEIWKEIDQHLRPEQTVGYELECPGVKLDITSGANPNATAQHLRNGYYPSFESLLTEEERQTKTLDVDAQYKKVNASWFDDLAAAGVWKSNPEWPYFDTYGTSLFQTQKSFMKFPLLNVTLESRYSYDQFPHVELVSAPLSKSSTPLNHSNIAHYMSDVVASACNMKNPSDMKFTKLTDWKVSAENTTIATENGAEKLTFEMTADKTFDKTPMSCNVEKLNGCHVQSNVGVYLDQLFTDAFLVQTIGFDWAGNSDETYNAAWNVAKNTFSVLQWNQNSDKIIDARNHAAGIFTYTIYDLYLRSILYAGKYDFWKGTITQLMKYELRRIWQNLDNSLNNEDEQELFQQAALALYEMKELPKELKAQIQPVMQALAQTKYYGIGPELPSGERPVYNDDFVEKVQETFRELLWTVALANEEVYARAESTEWGYVVSEKTDLSYIDAKGEKQTRRAFVQGCAYGTHSGAQCDIAKVIKPVRSSVKTDAGVRERMYGIIETRYGNAEFNQAIFWRCHDSKRSSALNHECE